MLSTRILRGNRNLVEKVFGMGLCKVTARTQAKLECGGGGFNGVGFRERWGEKGQIERGDRET